jgi:CAAX protease family protein
MSISNLIAEYGFYVLVYQAVCALAAASVARYRQRDQGNWFILGFILGIFAVIAVLLAKKQPDELAARNNLLLDSEHYLRSGWRLVLFFMSVLILYYLSAVLAKLSGVVPTQSFFFLFYIDVLLATYLMLRMVDKRKFTSVGFPYHGKILKEISLGVLIGAVMIGLVGGVELALGAVKLNPRPGQGVLLLIRNFGLSFIFFGFFAMGEELIFRGYPFQALIEGLGAVAATVVMSVIFGVVHLMNPDANFFSTLNTMLAGVWLSIAYLKTKTLYFPFGMHFSWNLVQSFFLSLPVSGLLTNRTIFIPHDFGPEWLTGGTYGPEAGAATTVVMVAAIIYFMLDKRIKPAYDYRASKERVTSAKMDSTT